VHQALINRHLNTEVLVRFWASTDEILGDKVALGEVFLCVLRVSTVRIIPSTHL